MVGDLWPNDIAEDRVPTPAGILREQATALGVKTNNLVEGEIQTRDSSSSLGYIFYLLAPSLNNYRYGLLTITHGIELYPVSIQLDAEILEEIAERVEVRVVDDGREQWRYVWAETPDDFCRALREIFAASKTRRIVRALLSQADPDWGPPPGFVDENEIPF